MFRMRRKEEKLVLPDLQKIRAAEQEQNRQQIVELMRQISGEDLAKLFKSEMTTHPEINQGVVDDVCRWVNEIAWNAGRV